MFPVSVKESPNAWQLNKSDILFSLPPFFLTRVSLKKNQLKNTVRVTSFQASSTNARGRMDRSIVISPGPGSVPPKISDRVVGLISL